MKPNNKLLCVHRQSNHPPALLRNVAKNINKRLTSISSSESIFDEAVAPYQKALDESGYNHKLTYNPEANQTTRSRKNRKRNIVWYNMELQHYSGCATNTRPQRVNLFCSSPRFGGRQSTVTMVFHALA